MPVLMCYSLFQLLWLHVQFNLYTFWQLRQEYFIPGIKMLKEKLKLKDKDGNRVASLGENGEVLANK